MNPRLEITPAGIKFYSPYDASLVASLKDEIPATARKAEYHPNGKFSHWLVSDRYEQALVDICKQYFPGKLVVMSVAGKLPQTEQRLLRVEYIGGLKDRGNGELTALAAVPATVVFGDSNYERSTPLLLDWPIILSESVLRQWFEGGNKGTILSK